MLIGNIFLTFEVKNIFLYPGRKVYSASYCLTKGLWMAVLQLFGQLCIMRQRSFTVSLLLQAEWWRSRLVKWVLSKHPTLMIPPLGKQVMGTRSSLGSIWFISASCSIWNSKTQKQKNDEFSELALCRAGEQSIVVEYIYLPLQNQFLWGQIRDKDSCILQEPDDTQHPLCLLLWYVLPEEFSIISPNGNNVKIFTRSPSFLVFHLSRNSTCKMIEIKMPFPRSRNDVHGKVT